MTIAEIIDKLRQERDIECRFPARIIFTEDLKSYSDLVTQLKSACDVTINLADFGRNDVVPQFDKMQEALTQYKDQQVLILSAGEYLRMCIGRELDKERAQFPSFWEKMQEESSRRRLILPVFSCRDCFDRIIGVVNQRQRDFVWTLEPARASKHYSVSVYSPQFAGAIHADAPSFEAWLRNWDVIWGQNPSCAIISRQCRWAEATFGTISVKPIDSPFAYLTDLLVDGGSLDKAWEPDSFWAQLIPAVKKGMKFSDLVKDLLGVTAFDFAAVIARWKTLSSRQRELIWLWYRIYPTDEYYSYVCKKARKADEIPDRIRDEILLLASRSQDWISERMNAMQVLGFTAFDDAYFKLLDKLPLAEMKLQLLTYKTHEECAYAVKTVSGLLREGAEPGAAAEMLREAYPMLAAYMSESSGLDGEIDEYFAWYRKNKLINRFCGNYGRRISFDRFDARFKQLSKMNGKDCFTLWIDGFGMEWLPVFLKELALREIRPESSSIAVARLPTKTEYNHQWDENDPMSEKWNRLDSLSHKGMPDDKSYFSCIAYQLAVFAEAAKKVDDLLDEHEYVAVTGDHGSSRLAALAFHDAGIVPVTAPAQAKVRSFGRFCELADNGDGFVELDFMKKVTVDNKTYVVMEDYNQFSISGNAAGGNTDDVDVVGEIHGGDTPEERLVPVVIIRRPQPLPALTCRPKSSSVMRKNGHVEANLSFSRRVFSLEAAADSLVGLCASKPDGTWDISFDGVTGDELHVSVVANGRLLPDRVTLKIKGQGISKNEGMGGLP